MVMGLRVPISGPSQSPWSLGSGHGVYPDLWEDLESRPSQHVTLYYYRVISRGPEAGPLFSSSRGMGLGRRSNGPPIMLPPSLIYHDIILGAFISRGRESNYSGRMRGIGV